MGDGEPKIKTSARVIWWDILQEMLWEILVEMLQKMLLEMVEGKKLFKKGSDWWKSSICKGVMGSELIIIQFCGKWWMGNLVGNSVGNAAGNSARDSVGNSLRSLVGIDGGEKLFREKLFKKGSDWWKSSILKG